MPNLAVPLVFKIALPWAFKALGLEKDLRERWLRVPSTHLQDAVDAANATLRNESPGTPPLTLRQWRAVEATQAKILSDGIEAKVR